MLARYDGELKAIQEVGLSDVFSTDMLSPTDERLRREAITCYLSGSDGWQEAIKLLRGAFAPDERRHQSRLTSGKAD